MRKCLLCLLFGLFFIVPLRAQERAQNPFAPAASVAPASGVSVPVAQVASPAPATSFDPAVSVKTNLLYDATTTLNAGVELGVGEQWTIDLPANYNPWTFSGGRKIKHWLIQPALRYWPREAFSGSFWALHAHGGQFNVGHIGDQARRQGWLVGAGLSYGHRWNLSEHWGVEAEIGVGYARLDFDKYDASDECTRCGTLQGEETKNYVGATKAALSLVYTFGRTKQPAPKTFVPPPPVRDTIILQPQPQRDTIYIASVPTVVEYRQERGEASIQFPVNQSTLHPEMGQNRSELMKIARSMEAVRRDPSAIIQGITIKAFSSPEGDSARNEALARQRAENLRNYMVETFQLPDTLFNIIDGGENWEGLRQAIAISPDLTRAEREDLSKILLTPDIAERKARLRAYGGGEIYTRLLREVYPLLRVSEYTITYTIPLK